VSTPERVVVDPTKGKPGGKIVIQAFGYPGAGVTLVSVSNAGIAQFAGFTHSGLLELRNGTPEVPGDDVLSVGPDLAQAMPEQPDDLTYRFKVRNARFHNGRQVTADDVKYSLERYAFWDRSAYRVPWSWLDKVEVPDAESVVVKTKYPFAETFQSLAARNDAFILAREHEESPDAEKKLMGSGPFTFVESQPPVSTRFRKNPEYFNKPFPYFDEIELLGTSDFAKKVADFTSRQVHMTYWHGEEEHDQIKAARPDAKLWRWHKSGNWMIIRTDQPPFNDKRVRQALSMGINRKEIRDATAKGRGEDDQVFTFGVPVWGTRRPKDLGPAARYWEYNPAEAKKLLLAAGVGEPIDAPFLHWDAAVIGQAIVDEATLVQNHWRQAGLANMKDTVVTFAQSVSNVNTGNYEGMYLGPSGTFLNPAFGITLRNTYAWPVGGQRPLTNTGYIQNPELNELLDKQLTQLNLEERKKTIRQIEEIFAEEQYRIVLGSAYYNFFGDPSVKNMQVPILAWNGGIGYVKYWWFDRA
jgi:glutathione transport system substrate-binding protein